MPGQGFAPRDPSKLVGHNAPQKLRVIQATPVPQPPLPIFHVTDVLGNRKQFLWPARTHEWWRMWGASPLAAEFTSTDWSELLDTAMLHARFWEGDTKLAAELRLRVAKFGATPEDRARLRITFAQADDAEAKPASRTPSSRSRREPLKAVGD